MRRSHFINGGEYPPGGNMPRQTPNMLEDENQRMEDELSSKVKTLKELTINIGNEVREQNQFLSGMEEDYDKSGNLLQATMGRLSAITKAGGPKLWCYMFTFIFFVFFMIWVIIKFR